MNLRPTPAGWLLLGLLPFVILAFCYLLASDSRLAANPGDKLLPSLGSFAQAIDLMALQEDVRTGKRLLWSDTQASLQRLGIGIGISALLGLAFGVMNGLLPLCRAGLGPFISMLAMVPPMAVLPILFIVFGLGELSKVALIVIGITPVLIRDLQQRTLELPAEQRVKIQTLGAGTWLAALRMVLPQILPRLLDAVRLSLGAAWLFLIAAEAIAATDGLGYRIFLVRRYLAMDVILPYVAWITVLACLLDYALRQLARKAFPWYEPARQA